MIFRPTTFPLNSDPQGPTSQTSATQLSERYKNMLGSQAASFDVGLFYQLEQAAKETEQVDELGNYEKGQGRQFENITRYGNYAKPIEAGGSYT